MKQLTILVTFLLVSVIAFSQTKRIAHRSHSGKDHTFNILSPDNFGLPVEKEKRPKTKPKGKTTPKKDSLKILPPVKTDTVIKTVSQPVTKQQVTKEEVYLILIAARKRYKSIGLF